MTRIFVNLGSEDLLALWKSKGDLDLEFFYEKKLEKLEIFSFYTMEVYAK